MAEQASRKIAAQSAIADDDPFAELTRIMGFDPREPAKPATLKEVKPAVQADPEPSLFEQSDLSLDLERELLGDLADDTLHASEGWQFSAAPEALSHEARAIEQPELEATDFAAQYQADEAASGLSAQAGDVALDYVHESFPEEGNAAAAEAYDFGVQEQVGLGETLLHDGLPDQVAPQSAQPEESVEFEFAAAFDEHLNVLAAGEPESEDNLEIRSWPEAADLESPQGEAQTEYAAEETSWAQSEMAPQSAEPDSSLEFDFPSAFDEQLNVLVEAEPDSEEIAEDRAWPEAADPESSLADGQTEYAAEETSWAQHDVAPQSAQSESSVEVDFGAAFDEHLNVVAEGAPESEEVAEERAWQEATNAESPLAEAQTEYAAEDQLGAQWNQNLDADRTWSEAADPDVPRSEVRTEFGTEYQAGEQRNEHGYIGSALTEAEDLQASHSEVQTEYAAEYQPAEQWNQDGLADRSWPEEADLDASKVEFDATLDAGHQVSEEWNQEVAADHVSLAAADLELPQGEVPVAYEVAYQSDEQHQDPVDGWLQESVGEVQEETTETADESVSAEPILNAPEESELKAVAVAEWHEEPRAWEEANAPSGQAAPLAVEPRYEEYFAAAPETSLEYPAEVEEAHARSAPEPIPQPTPAEALELSLEQELNALLGDDFAADDQQQVPEEEPAFEASAEMEPVQNDLDEDWVRMPLRGPLSGDHEWGAAADSDAHRPSAAYFDEDGHGRAQDRYDLHEAHAVAAAPEPELDFTFDDHAFAAALTSAVTAEAVDEREPGPIAGQAEETMPRDDPYAALAALTASLQPSQFNAPVQARVEPHSEHASSFANSPAKPAIREDVPDIETIDVPEQAVALADDLELPEITFEPEPVPMAPFDDLDAEFSSLLEDMNVRGAEIASVAPQSDASREIRLNAQAEADPYGNDAVPAAGAEMAGTAFAAGAAQPQGYDIGYASKPDAAAYLRQQSADQAEFNDIEFAFDPNDDEDFAEPDYVPVAEKTSRKRGLIIAAVVGGVAMLGGIGALAMSFGSGSGGDEVALVKADPSPVKVKPENPGGVSIPNQDSKVYDTVAGAGTAAEPTQQKLISSAEEPVEIPMPDDDIVDLPGVDGAGLESAQATLEGGEAGAGAAAAHSAKGEDRVDQTAGANGVDETMEVAAVAPRKVRTMIVKADGTLVPREEPAPAADQAAELASESVDPVAATLRTAEAQTEATAAAAAGSMPEAAAADQTAAAQPAEATTHAQGTIGITPERAPIAPARPSDQPLDIVGEVKPQQVAGLAPAAAGGSWSIQIASQPTEAAAQSSYQDLLRRYGGVLEGKQANIVKAEVEGKGTYWRVRVPAESRNDAVKLCESYKAAGGNCFVTR